MDPETFLATLANNAAEKQNHKQRAVESKELFWRDLFLGIGMAILVIVMLMTLLILINK